MGQNRPFSAPSALEGTRALGLSASTLFARNIYQKEKHPAKRPGSAAEPQQALAVFYVSRSRFQCEITITNELEVTITAIAERIRFFRKARRVTQTQLGMLLGFPKGSANVRLAQYETGARTPKNGLVTEMAQVLGASPQALTVPDIDSDIGLIHTLFALEDRYGLTIGETGGDVCLQVDENQGTDAVRLCKMLRSWNQAAVMLKAGEISREDYDQWRYNYALMQLRG